MKLSHQTISFVKSGLRFAACLVLFPYFPLSASLLFLAEVIGVVEEIGHE